MKEGRNWILFRWLSSNPNVIYLILYWLSTYFECHFYHMLKHFSISGLYCVELCVKLLWYHKFCSSAMFQYPIGLASSILLNFRISLPNFHFIFSYLKFQSLTKLLVFLWGSYLFRKGWHIYNTWFLYSTLVFTSAVYIILISSDIEIQTEKVRGRDLKNLWWCLSLWIFVVIETLVISIGIHCLIILNITIVCTAPLKC